MRHCPLGTRVAAEPTMIAVWFVRILQISSHRRAHGRSVRPMAAAALGHDFVGAEPSAKREGHGNDCDYRRCGDQGGLVTENAALATDFKS